MLNFLVNKERKKKNIVEIDLITPRALLGELDFFLIAKLLSNKAKCYNEHSFKGLRL